jgi:hypothetical protein
MGCSDIARSLKVPSCFLDLADKGEVIGSVAHCLALVPEALHVAQELDAPVLQSDGRERVVCAARCMDAVRVRPIETGEDEIAGSVAATLQELL